MSALKITVPIHDLRTLLSAVTPFACVDGMLPVLCAVQVRTQGKWLTATATDRFRASVQRVEKQQTDDDLTTEWPEFEALIPLPAVKAILAMFRPARSGPLAEVTLTVEDGMLTVEASGLFVLFDQATMRYRLETGEFPKMDSVFAKALARPANEDASLVGLNPLFLADYKHIGREPLQIRVGAGGNPTLLTSGDGLFLSLLMPRRLLDSSRGEKFPDHAWTDLFPAPTAGKEVAA